MSTSILSRRDFLKITAASALGMLASNLHLGIASAAQAPKEGRVVYLSLVVRDAPSFGGKKVKSYRRDTILQITGQLLGGVESDYNRTWYKLGDEGYVYSGGVQPVETILNGVMTDIPASGVLGEITVPYADSVWSINRSPTPGPRLYYASTHWVDGLVVDQRDGSLWYKAFDNLSNSHYFTRPEWTRILTDSDLSPISQDVPEDRKRIEVNLDRQLLVAYEMNIPVFAGRVATGQTHYETPTGLFRTFHKRPTYHMTGGADASTMFDLPGVPWDSYITDTGVAIHGTYWHNDFGHPHSHGCINMAPADAKWIYRWTHPTVPKGERLSLHPGQGTLVSITHG